MLAFSGSALATLSDNRAYEIVSPIEKGGLSFISNLAVPDASGEHVIVSGGSRNALLSSGASWMLETRTPSGWTGTQIGPPPAPEADEAEQEEVSLDAVNEDFSSFAFQTRMALDARDSTRGMGEYVRTLPASAFNWVTGPPAPSGPVSDPTECAAGLEPAYCTTNRAVFAGGSGNLADVVWGEYHPSVAPPASLPGSPADTHEHGYEVYESVSGTPQLVGVVPASGEECGPSGGSCVVPPCGAAMGNEGGEVDESDSPTAKGFAPVAGAVSGDGSEVLFTSPDPVPYHESVAGCSAPDVYMRENGTTTVQVSASQKAGGDPSGPQEKVYAGSSEEGGRLNTVFFISKEELTEDANTGGSDEGDDLYAYSLATRHLTDLTPTNNTAEKKLNQVGEEYEAAEVIFLGSSTNGQLVYFTATSVLTAELNSHGQAAKPGVSNLYVYDEHTGLTRFIASGSGLRAPYTGMRYLPHSNPTEAWLTSEVTPDGQHLVFASLDRITAYDNFGPECVGAENAGIPKRSPGRCAEIYTYSALANSVTCVSCNPSGAPPTGGARLPARTVEGYFDGGLEPGTLPPPKAISDDGSRVFFSSPDQLTAGAPSPTTTRGPQAPIAINWEYEPNVYEYEAGQVHLLAPEAVLLTITPSGDDVFVDTYGRLTPQDNDGSPDVYDARVDGGFPVLAAPACSGTSCQGAPAVPPIFATPTSVTFSGVGNFPAPSSAPAKLKTAAQVRAEKLAKALRICHSKYLYKKRSRTSCEKSAEKQYRAVRKKAKAKKVGHDGRASR